MNLEAQGQIAAHNWNLGVAVNYMGRTPATVVIPAKVTDTNLTFAIRAITNTLGHSVPMINGFVIAPDTDAPHIGIDYQQIHVVTAGAQLQLYPVDWFSGSHDTLWSVLGPGMITPTGVYVAPLNVTTGQWVTVRARDRITGLSASYFLFVPASPAN
jgi:hypothetical protein